MSNDMKLSLTRAALVVGLLVSASSLLGAFVILPQKQEEAERRITANEKRIDELQRQIALDHAAIERIDERTAWLVQQASGTKH